MPYLSIENQLKIGYTNKKSFKEFLGSFDIISVEIDPKLNFRAKMSKRKIF